MSNITVAVSEDSCRRLFNTVVSTFHIANSNSADFGPFSAGYNVAAHLQGGTFDLRANNTARIGELDIKWDQLSAWIGLDIPELCIGGFCVIPNPFGGCLVRVPRICVFSADPDITIPLDLSSLLTTEVSVIAAPVVRYHYGAPGSPNEWRIFLDPVSVDLDPIDIADTVGDFLQHAAEAAVNGLLGFLPRWARNVLLSILGSIIDLIRTILDIPDDIGEWLSDLLGMSLGLVNFLTTAILDYFAAQQFAKVEDPFPIDLGLPGSGGPAVVRIPLPSLTVYVDDLELVAQVDVGAP
jgi:hypothetical protein